MEVVGYILTALIVVIGAAIIAYIINGLHIDGTIDNEVGKISFRESMDLLDLPVITFMNNGKKLNFLLDTGSSHSSINLYAVEGLQGKKLDEISFFIGVDGKKQETQWMTAPVTYKERDYEEDFQVHDLSEAFGVLKEEYGVNLHGILGNTFFQKYKYVLNFKELVAYSLK